MSRETNQEQINNELMRHGIHRKTCQPLNGSDEPQPQRVAISSGFEYTSDIGFKLFTTLGAMYGNLWMKEYGEVPTAEFNHWSVHVDHEMVRRIIERCKEQFTKGIRFPPPLGEMIVWGEMPTDSEFHQMLTRVLSRKYNDRLEQWIVIRRLYDLKLKPEAELLKYLKMYYQQAVALKAKGELFAEEREFLALPKCKEVNLSEKAIADFKTRGGKNPFQSRIDALLAKGRK